MQGEIWKPIKGYEENYCVSNYGRIKSTYHAYEKFLSPRDAGKGYMQVALFKDHKAKNFFVHRLVAEHFVENPDGFDFVNHKDENKSNNVHTNLEWCSASYNNTYGTRMRKVRKKVQQSLNGVVIATYDSMTDAGKAIGQKSGAISRCCHGFYKTCGGYAWTLV